MNNEKEVRVCPDCGKTVPYLSMWCCPDNILRCGPCVTKREFKAYPLLEKKEGGRV